jgi:hypothetical protein
MALKHSLLIRIEEPIQEFQQDLHAKGGALRQLLKCPFPDADAVMAVVDSIESALTFRCGARLRGSKRNTLTSS